MPPGRVRGRLADGVVAAASGDGAEARVLHRDRLRRLLFRQHGAEAQRVLHPQHHQVLGLQAVSKFAARGVRIRQSLLEVAGGSTASRRCSTRSICWTSGPTSRPGAGRRRRSRRCGSGWRPRPSSATRPWKRPWRTVAMRCCDAPSTGPTRSTRRSGHGARSAAVPEGGGDPPARPRRGRHDRGVSTPGEALQREWEEHDIAQYVNVICGQEVGKKSQMLAAAAAGGIPRTGC